MSDFKGFRFGNIHIKDLHLTVVSSGDRFNKNLLPDPTDYSVDVPGGNGKYYFGQTHSTRNYPVKTAFDNLDEATIRRIRQIFVTDKLKDLVFDEEPYKTYRAKLSRAPSFNYVCFLDKETNQRVYKGECDFDFILYHPYAFCFNKYIVTAADYYKCTPPELIIKPTEDTFKLNDNPVPPLNKTIKNHYNVENNMDEPWRGGYPTIEQVQNGELFFNDPNGGTKSIINIRGYWDNIPRWQVAAKLLTSPTLDYEQELIYMPQYSQSRYYNMDIGLDKRNSAIGSRLLVYNPGDIPVDFKLNLTNITNNFRKLGDYTFRVSRYNVQRLTIDQAVDWVGLKTFKEEDNDDYKYGKRYFKILKTRKSNKSLKNLDFSEPQQGEQKTYDRKLLDNMKEELYTDLTYSHPTHCYIAEPIPQERLGDFIRLFYRQTNLLFDPEDNPAYQTEYESVYSIDMEQGENFAKRYEDLREMCINDDERNELYWKTLKEAILDRYKEYNESLEENKIFDDNYTYENFVYDFINNPYEYVRQTNDLNYGEFNFNLSRPPQFYTYDYLDISNENFDKISSTNKTLTLDSESRLLYNEIELEWNPNDENLQKNFFKVSKTKINFNDNIKCGHWFQLPPGWSLIDVSPIVDEGQWGGKRWEDARSFKWGVSGSNAEKIRTNYDSVFYEAVKIFLKNFYPERIPVGKQENEIDWDSLIKFRLWYGEYTDSGLPTTYANKEREPRVLQNCLRYSIQKSRSEKDEIKFLRFLNDCFNYFGVQIDDWWWNSNNYLWVNYPPLYWGFIDLLNKASIEYIPQYY